MVVPGRKRSLIILSIKLAYSHYYAGLGVQVNRKWWPWWQCMVSHFLVGGGWFSQNANAGLLRPERQLARKAHARQLINLSSNTSNNQSQQERDWFAAPSTMVVGGVTFILVIQLHLEGRWRETGKGGWKGCTCVSGWGHDTFQHFLHEPTTGNFVLLPSNIWCCCGAFSEILINLMFLLHHVPSPTAAFCKREPGFLLYLSGNKGKVSSPGRSQRSWCDTVSTSAPPVVDCRKGHDLAVGRLDLDGHVSVVGLTVEGNFVVWFVLRSGVNAVESINSDCLWRIEALRCWKRSPGSINYLLSFCINKYLRGKKVPKGKQRQPSSPNHEIQHFSK